MWSIKYVGAVSNTKHSEHQCCTVWVIIQGECEKRNSTWCVNVMIAFNIASGSYGHAL